MKLIVKYTVGDGCSYSCDVVQPAIYSSAEVLYCDIIDKCEKAYEEKEREFEIGGLTFDVNYFIYKDLNYVGRDPSLYGRYIRDWPEVMTIDEWFEQSIRDKEIINKK